MTEETSRSPLSTGGIRRVARVRVKKKWKVVRPDL